MRKPKTREKSNVKSINDWQDRLVYSTDASRADAAEESFVNKPFRQLEARKFKAVRNGLKNKSAAAIGSDVDREMFLRAVLQPKPEKKSALPSGFKLADHCPLVALAPKKSKNKKASPPALPPAQPLKAAEEDENAAFLLAMRKTKPLPGRGREIAKKPVLRENIVSEQCFEDLLEQQLEFTLLFSDEYLEGKVAGLDEMIMNRLREGQMSPEAHLDMHGLNAEQAFESLRVFIRDAWFKSLRVVLLVPGRGKNSPAGYGILRRKVQEWLTHDPFKRVVLAFCTARPHDGGPGSIYVLLRKFRKKGHISWDKLSADADLFNF